MSNTFKLKEPQGALWNQMIAQTAKLTLTAIVSQKLVPTPNTFVEQFIAHWKTQCTVPEYVNYWDFIQTALEAHKAQSAQEKVLASLPDKTAQEEQDQAVLALLQQQNIQTFRRLCQHLPSVQNTAPNFSFNLEDALSSMTLVQTQHFSLFLQNLHQQLEQRQQDVLQFVQKTQQNHPDNALKVLHKKYQELEVRFKEQCAHSENLQERLDVLQQRLELEPSTQTLNLKGLVRAWRKEYARWVRKKSPLVFLTLKLYPATDKALSDETLNAMNMFCAHYFIKSLRPEDHIGFDREKQLFYIILPDTTEHVLHKVTQRLQTQLTERKFIFKGIYYPIETSAGAVALKHEQELVDIQSLALRMLEQAKVLGSNKFLLAKSTPSTPS